MAKSKLEQFLSSCIIHIVDFNIIRARMNVFETQIPKFGGLLIKKQSNNDQLTHILVDDDLSEETVIKLIRSHFPDLFGDTTKSKTKIVRTKWLSGCIKQKKLIDTTPFEIYIPRDDGGKKASPSKREQRRYTSSTDGKRDSSLDSKSRSSSDPENRVHVATVRKKNDSSSDKSIVFDQSTDDESSDEAEDLIKFKRTAGRITTSPTPPEPKRPHLAEESVGSGPINHNKLITDKLQILADGYRSVNDKWRSLSYDKAIVTLKRLPKPISGYEEVRNLRGIGQRLADKIWEIHQSGTLRKADEFLNDEKIRTMTLFTNIFGVGPTIAHQWYAQGLRTLKDIEERGNPNFQQRLGIKYYEEFKMRMDRSEATEIVNIVGKALKDIDPAIVYDCCGSYRRGAKTCGDVDILFTHPDGRSHEGVLGQLVKKLTLDGYLTDDLVDCDSGHWNQQMYMGVFKLKGDQKMHRRIDILAFPRDEYASALVAWTGSQYFLRQLYSYAKSCGMRMNQHGLRGGIMRQGDECITDGYLIPTPTEESVFEKLGVPYRKPEERDTAFMDL